MKFCKYCGKQLEDDAVCDCKDSLNAAQFSQSPHEPVGCTFQDNQKFSSPYAMNGTHGENKFITALKNFPVLFCSFWKDSKGTIKIAKNNKDIMIAVICSFIFFASIFLGNMFSFISMHTFDFFRVLITSCILALLIGSFFTLIMAFAKKISNRTSNIAACLIDSFISFSIESIPASIGFIIAGLALFINFYASAFFILLTALYLIVTLTCNIKDTIINVNNNAAFVIITSLTACIALGIILAVLINLYTWCVEGGIYSQFSSALGYISDYLN